MENLTTKERQLFHSLEGFMCMSRNSSATDVYLERFLAVFNFLLSIIASLGNLLILVALPKTCSLHSPSKILYRCLATTDFCVGVVAQPAFAVQLLYNNGERRELCYMSLRLSFCAGVILCGVSMTTLAALSVDRLLALLLTLRYRNRNPLLSLNSHRSDHHGRVFTGYAHGYYVCLSKVKVNE